MFFQLGTQDVMESQFRDAGFEKTESVRLTVILKYDSAEDAIGAAFAGGPVALAYSRFDDGTRHAAHEEYLASIVDCRDGDGYSIPGEFVVTRGWKS
jgi:hypothetical protein